MTVGFQRSVPGCLGRNHGEVLDLSFLSGKTIVEAGLLDFSGVPPEAVRVGEGGFAIDYKGDDGAEMRVVFGFNELGIWISKHGRKGGDPREDELRARVVSGWNNLCEAVRIKDDALGRRYLFVTEDGREVFSLSCSDLKLMGKSVSGHFGKAVKEFDQVLLAIESWAFYA